MTGAVGPVCEKAPLRVGVFVESMRQRRWVRTLLATISASKSSTIALVIPKDVPQRGERGARQRVRRIVAQ